MGSWNTGPEPESTHHFSQVDPMTALYTERLHRRVNWPPVAGARRTADDPYAAGLIRRMPFAWVPWNTGPEPETITFHKLIL